MVDKDNVSSTGSSPSLLTQYDISAAQGLCYWEDGTFKAHKDIPRHSASFHDRDHKGERSGLTWTSRGQCSGSPLGAQSMKGSEAPREAALITKTWASFLEWATVVFRVMIDQALLCWVSNQPIPTRDGSRLQIPGTWGESTRVWALRFKSQMQPERMCRCSWTFGLYNFNFQGEIHFPSHWIQLL